MTNSRDLGERYDHPKPLTETPEGGVEKLADELRKYELATPAHITVADFEAFEGLEDYKFENFSILTSDTSKEDLESLKSKPGEKFIICKTGEIELEVDGKKVKIAENEGVYISSEKNIESINLSQDTIGEASLSQTEEAKEIDASIQPKKIFNHNLRIFDLSNRDELVDLNFGEFEIGEAEKFEGKRIYFWDPENREWYGEHAHKNGRQFHICIEGEIEYRINPEDNIDIGDLELFEDSEEKLYQDEEGDLHDQNGLEVETIQEGEIIFLPEEVWYKLKKKGDVEDTRLMVISDVTYDREENYQDMTLKEFRDKNS
jgi:quercetin dioxygenase-like cupin family protein